MLKKNKAIRATKKAPFKRRRKIKIFQQKKHPIAGLFSKTMKALIQKSIGRLKGHHFPVENHQQAQRHK